MAHKKINPILKFAIEIGPLIIFFISYSKLKGETFSFAGTQYDGFIVVTALFIPLMLLSTFLLWKLTGKLSHMQLATAVLVVVFGGLSIWFNDERFFKMKPTMIYLLFAGILGFGLWRGESYLKFVMEELMPLQQKGWMILTRRLMLFFLTLAIANEIIWRSMSTDAWVKFKVFGLTIAIFVFFITQSKLFQTYAVEETEDSDDC